jgi:hypothetical protein
MAAEMVTLLLLVGPAVSSPALSMVATVASPVVQVTVDVTFEEVPSA